jgi:hypothetical protein
LPLRINLYTIPRESIFSFLEKRVEDCSSLLCIGLDPHAADLPEKTLSAVDNEADQGWRPMRAFKRAAFDLWPGRMGCLSPSLKPSVRIGPARLTFHHHGYNGNIASSAKRPNRLQIWVWMRSLLPPCRIIQPLQTGKGVFFMQDLNPGSRMFRDRVLTLVRLSLLYVHIARMKQG